MTEITNSYIDQLNGYLRCLSQLCGPRFAFGAVSFVANSDIDAFADELVEIWSEDDDYAAPTSYRYLGKEKIEYSDLLDEITLAIFNGCISSNSMPSSQAYEYARRVITDDINEYYGLVSTGLNKKGVIHPLISGPVYKLDISNKDISKSLYFVVKIEDIYVLTRYEKYAE